MITDDTNGLHQTIGESQKLMNRAEGVICKLQVAGCRLHIAACNNSNNNNNNNYNYNNNNNNY